MNDNNAPAPVEEEEENVETIMKDLCAPRYKPVDTVPPDEHVARWAYAIWQEGSMAGSDDVAIWHQAQKMIMSCAGIPTHLEIRYKAYELWEAGYSTDAEANWYEARRALAARSVWKNPFLRMTIISHMDTKTALLSLAKVSKALDKEVTRILVAIAKLQWYQNGWNLLGRPQVVLNMTRGEIHLTRKKGFHPLNVFDMFDD